MKQKLSKIFAVMLLAIVASCTTNNGDIGQIAGIWKVAEITCDGAKDEGYHGDVFFMFQNTVFEMRRVSDNAYADDKYGRWEDNGEALVITFPDENYVPFAETHFSQEKNVLTYTKIDRGGFELKMLADDGHIYTYKLKYWR